MEITIKSAEELSLAIRHTLFASRPDLEQAFAYAYEVIETLKPKDRAAALTALHVVVNTIADTIDEVTA